MEKNPKIYYRTPYPYSVQQSIIIIMIATMIVYVTIYHTYHDRSIGVIGMIDL